MTSYINKFLLTVGIFIIIFKSVEVSTLTYALLLIVAWGLIISNFWLYKNPTFFNSLITINLGIYVSFIIVYWINKKSILPVYQDKWLWIATLAIPVTLYFKYMFKFIKFNNSNDINERNEIFPKRKKDLENILYYLDVVDIVGINSKWGTGKTFIVENMKDILKKQYEIIEIDLLACNFNELQVILISALEDILYKNGIAPKYANKIKSNIANTSALSKFQDFSNLILNNSTGNSELFSEFKNELQKIDKKILLIFEDIDRISNKSVITEVFAIAEKLSHDNLKIVYQYDEEILKKLEYDNSFLEKYIPFKVNLTDIHVKEIIEFELQKDNYSNLTIEDFMFLWRQDNRFYLNLKEKIAYTFKIDYFPIRVIKHMLIELNMALKDNKEVYEMDNEFKEVIIGFYVLKHLYPNSYNRININEGLLDSLYFKINDTDNIYAIKNLISDFNADKLEQKFFDELLSTEENIDTYRILKLFNYKFINRNEDFNDYHYFKVESKNIYYNEKANRIIRNLMYRGTSILTDMEYAVKKFCEDVLEKSIDEQQFAYENYNKQLFYLDRIKDDQTTIYKIGLPFEPFIFKAFEVVNNNPDMQLRLIDFYFKYMNIKQLDLNVLKCLNHCPLDSTEEYFKILDYVNHLKIIQNFDGSEYLNFLKKYMQAISRLGISSDVFEYFDDFSKFYKIDDQKMLFLKFKNKFTDLNRKYNQKGLISFNTDLNTIVQFFDKLLEISDFKKPIEYGFTKDIGAELEVSREKFSSFDRFKELLVENNYSQEIYKQIDEAYKEGNLPFYQFTKLLSMEPSTKKLNPSR